MTSYNTEAVDLFQLDLLADGSITRDEAANALTALGVLTNSYPQLFPSGQSFVKVDRRYVGLGSELVGIRFVAYWPSGNIRTLRVPLKSLEHIEDTINEVFDAVRGALKAVA